MPINSNITDPLNNNVARVDAPENEKSGLIVATRPLKTFNNWFSFFTNDEGSNELNIDASFGGAPDVVYAENAGSPAEWDTSAISGTWDFASLFPAHGGAACIDATATVNDSECQFDEAGAGIDLTNFVAITGWIYITSWGVQGTKEVIIYGWDTTSGLQVGDSVNIGDYVNIGDQDTWLEFTILLGDMNLEGKTIDALRIKTVDIGPGQPPNYYLDDIQVEATGGEQFSINSITGSWLYIERVTMIISDAFTGITTVAGATANATLQNLPYNTILGLAALTNGIVFQQINDKSITTFGNFKQLSDFLLFPFLETIDAGSDGTNAWLKLSYKVNAPIILKNETLDKLAVSISEDLSGLLEFRIMAGGRLEKR